MFYFSDGAVSVVAKRDIGRLSKGIQYLKSYVVTGIVVLTSDISQANYQILHEMITSFRKEQVHSWLHELHG